MLVSVNINIDIVRLWEAVWGSEGSGITYWCDKIRQSDGSDINLWVRNDKGELVGYPQDFNLRVYDEETGKHTWHKVTLGQLAEAYAKALNDGMGHCGVGLSFEDSDACFGDIVLQYACFGKMIYG